MSNCDGKFQFYPSGGDILVNIILYNVTGCRIWGQIENVTVALWEM